MERQIDATEYKTPKDSVSVTCEAPVNIAVVKYWGKRDVTKLLPLNSSLSGTLHMDTLRSRTTITASKTFESNEMKLNGKKWKISKRLETCIREVKKRAQNFEDGEKVLIPKDTWDQYKLHIVSNNNFPTGAGLASSASGCACLTFCLSNLYRTSDFYKGELSTIARQGSGSACRSMYGGWVKWIKGEKPDGSDSIGVCVAEEDSWPDMRVLILVVNKGQKEVSSTSGMQTSVETSDLLKFRTERITETRTKEMEEAILNQDFQTFATLTIKDSNQFHAVCLDTFPPIFYMNEISRRIVNVIESLNRESNKIKAAYTFDAGPNAVLYLLKDHMEQVLNKIESAFPPKDPEEFIHDPMNLLVKTSSASQGVGSKRKASQSSNERPQKQQKMEVDRNNTRGHIESVYVTKIGPGPRLMKMFHTFEP